jgi:hypothetical protein
MIRAIKRGETRMTLPTDNDFSNRELSIEELDTIAAGGLWGWIKHEASSALHWVEGPGLTILSKILKTVSYPPRQPGSPSPIDA